MLGTSKGGTHARRVKQHCHGRWQNQSTLIPYILHIHIDPYVHLRKSSRRKSYSRKSCNLDSLYRNHEERVQRHLWRGKRQYWGRVWARFGTYKVWTRNLQVHITCRNKEDVKSHDTRKKSFSIQEFEDSVQRYPGMEVWRVVACKWDCGRQYLADEVIEVEWPRLIFLLHIGQRQRSLSRLLWSRTGISRWRYRPKYLLNDSVDSTDPENDPIWTEVRPDYHAR